MDTPVIPADIGTALVVLLFLVVAWRAVPWAWRWLIAGAVEARERLMKAARARTRRTVEDESGDQGSVTLPPEMQRAAKRPGAPDTGSGLRFGAGDTANIWPAPSPSWRADPKERN